MYIDIVPNRKSRPAVLLRESRREGSKTHKHTVANISHWDEARIEALKLTLAGKWDGLKPDDKKPDVPESGPIFGTLSALDQVASSIGLWQVLGNSRNAKLIKFLILARIAHQGSRLSAVRWAKNHAVHEVLGLASFDEDDLYAAMDWLAKEQATIEDKLFEMHVKKVGHPPALVLYDVTSSYLEGELNELAARGYNRDGKRGKLQIVIGLLTAPDGEPLAIEVFKGNTGDPKTVDAQIIKLVERFKVKEIVFVGDRGMVKAKGKETLHQHSYRYITALTDPQIRKLLKTNVLQRGLFDERIAEVQADDRRYVMYRDDSTRTKEMHRRDDKIRSLKIQVEKKNATLAKGKRAKPEKALRAMEQWAKKYRVASFVRLTLGDRVLAFDIDAAAMEESALLDGCYVLDTDVAQNVMTKEDVNARYRDLQKVERDFRTMKTGLLELRPIFVRKAQRTRAHAFVSMLGLKVARIAEQRLRKSFGTTDQDPHTDVLDDALVALSRLCILVYTAGDERIASLPRPDARQLQIQDALGVKIKLQTPPKAPAAAPM